MDSAPPPYTDEDRSRELRRHAPRELTAQELEKAITTENQYQKHIDESVVEIEAMAREGIQIDKKFKTVNGLCNVSHDSPKVEEYRESYVKLLWDSRRIASQIKAAINDFDGDLLDLVMDKETPTVKKVELKAFNEDVARREVTVRELAQDFHKLERILREFFGGTPGKDDKSEPSAEDATSVKAAEKSNGDQRVEGMGGPFFAVFKQAWNTTTRYGAVAVDPRETARESKRQKSSHKHSASRTTVEERPVATQDRLQPEQDTAELISKLRDDVTAFGRRLERFNVVCGELKEESQTIISLLDDGKTSADLDFYFKVTRLRHFLPRISDAFTKFSTMVN